MVAGARKRCSARRIGALRRPSRLQAQSRSSGGGLDSLDGHRATRRWAAFVEGINRSAEYFVELLAYPPRLDPQQMASSPEWTTHFDPKGDNGPAGSVRVELQLAHRDRPDRPKHLSSRRVLATTRLRLRGRQARHFGLPRGGRQIPRGKRKASSASSTVFAKRRMECGIPLYHGGNSALSSEDKTSRAASNPMTR